MWFLLLFFSFFSKVLRLEIHNTTLEEFFHFLIVHGKGKMTVCICSCEILSYTCSDTNSRPKIAAVSTVTERVMFFYMILLAVNKVNLKHSVIKPHRFTIFAHIYRGVQLANPFHTIWKRDLGEKVAVSFLIKLLLSPFLKFNL